jgi:methionyl-tRNA synthetase
MNKFLVEREPWTKPGAAESLDTLSECARSLRAVALCLGPAMPGAAAEITAALGFEPTDFVNFGWEDRQKSSARKLTGLFPRVDKAEYFGRLGRDRNREPENQRASEKESKMEEEKNKEKTSETKAIPAQDREALLTIDEFRRVELRAGKIVEADRVPKSNKLIRMVVDFGTERRQIVGGIGKKYAPEQLVGRTCPFVFNLAPAKLMGVESNGMIMAGNLDGEPILLQFLEDVPPGSRIT